MDYAPQCIFFAILFIYNTKLYFATLVFLRRAFLNISKNEKLAELYQNVPALF